MQGRVIKVSGPLIVAENMADCKMNDVVKVNIAKVMDVALEELRKEKNL